MSIKYYQLAENEELPDEFCAVRDIGGEPSEYTFYVPESENAKLRDAMFSNAKKHALHHMDEDELRIWATQQAEYIDELKELCADIVGIHAAVLQEMLAEGEHGNRRWLDERCKELGIEV